METFKSSLDVFFLAETEVKTRVYLCDNVLHNISSNFYSKGPGLYGYSIQFVRIESGYKRLLSQKRNNFKPCNCCTISKNYQQQFQIDSFQGKMIAQNEKNEVELRCSQG